MTDPVDRGHGTIAADLPAVDDRADLPARHTGIMTVTTIPMTLFLGSPECG